jgi:hypothetical protein
VGCTANRFPVLAGMDDLNAVFSASGTEFFFSVKLPNRGRHVMLAMTQERGRWSAPTVLPFSGRYNDADPALSPDGKTLYFAASRPLTPAAPEKDWDIWAVDRTAGGWGQPRRLDAPVNSEAMEVYPSFAANGTMYFSYPTVEVFDERIVSEYGAGDVFIAPDERTIIFSSCSPRQPVQGPRHHWGARRRSRLGRRRLRAGRAPRERRPRPLPAPGRGRARDAGGGAFAAGPSRSADPAARRRERSRCHLSVVDRAHVRQRRI